MTWGRAVAVVGLVIVAFGAGVLSWSANTWAAGEIGIDPWARWLYGVTIDGAIAVGTAAIFELEGRLQLVAWAVLLAALSVSVVGNGAHAAAGNPLHVLGATVPALLLAGCLLLVELLVRAPQGRARRESTLARAAPTEDSRPVYPPQVPSKRDQVRVLMSAAAAAGRRLTGRELGDALGVTAGHARKLRAQLEVAADG